MPHNASLNDPEAGFGPSVLINRDTSLMCRILAILGKTQRRPAGYTG